MLQSQTSMTQPASGLHLNFQGIDSDGSCALPLQANLRCSRVQFVKCDVRNWEHQISVFEAAVQRSPSKTCDVVIANAGIVGADDIFNLQGKTG
jgi:NAD(P)-dependent dehydrogenase (short-subunit alcohol dehydrogenase family)